MSFVQQFSHEKFEDKKVVNSFAVNLLSLQRVTSMLMTKSKFEGQRLVQARAFRNQVGTLTDQRCSQFSSILMLRTEM